MKKNKGPQFLEYAIPILNVLKENGGSGNASEIVDKVIEKLQISDEKVNETTSSNQSVVKNRIQWARFYLAKAGLIDTEKRGLWQLTQEGFDAKLDHEQVYKLFRTVHKKFEGPRKQNTATQEEDIDDEIVEDEEHSVVLLNLLKDLKSDGFEKICKRLLTEIGIHDIVITGRSGDQGIDGSGLIKLNEVVNFNIVFQCKKYKEAVSPHHVRDFRGAMQGRADKGLILTTGRFTQEAKKEASRDGVPPIELIDGEKLVSLFEKYQLGLKPITVYQIIPEFFKNFQ
ncbi:MAG: restriction endonuclease [Segetibacter sp.]|nr:restriction endonuclease [Segetibacter sp.]